MNQSVIHIDILPVEEEGFHLHTAVCINGEEANVLIDTGASRTVFDISRILRFEANLNPVTMEGFHSAGLGTSSMTISQAVISSFRVGLVELTEMNAALIDLSHVNDSYRHLGIQQIDGILGNDILLKYKAVINMEQKQLVLTIQD